MPTEPKYPKGLYFFHPESSTAHKKSRVLFVGVMTLIGLSIGWPIYPFFSGVYPLILGFPLSFMWIIGCLLLSLVALITLFRFDESSDKNSEEL